MTDYDCSICEAVLPVTMNGHNHKFKGGLTLHLCNDCSNRLGRDSANSKEWADYCDASNLFEILVASVGAGTLLPDEAIPRVAAAQEDLSRCVEDIGTLVIALRDKMRAAALEELGSLAAIKDLTGRPERMAKLREKDE